MTLYTCTSKLNTFCWVLMCSVGVYPMPITTIHGGSGSLLFKIRTNTNIYPNVSCLWNAGYKNCKCMYSIFVWQFYNVYQFVSREDDDIWSSVQFLIFLSGLLKQIIYEFDQEVNSPHIITALNMKL